MFDIDPDKPNIPGIARILSILGMICLIGAIAGMLLAFSRFNWLSQTSALAGASVSFLVAVLLIGQAKTIELLAVISARVKSRFAIEHAMLPVTQPATAAAPKPAPVTAAPKDRIITIPEDVARQQGVTRRARELE